MGWTKSTCVVCGIEYEMQFIYFEKVFSKTHTCSKCLDKKYKKIEKEEMELEKNAKNPR